jgi:hypothetical protein
MIIRSPILSGNDKRQAWCLKGYYQDFKNE